MEGVKRRGGDRGEERKKQRPEPGQYGEIMLWLLVFMENLTACLHVDGRVGRMYDAQEKGHK